MYFQRFKDKILEDWFIKPERKPLIVRGARQVGKSTFIRNISSKQAFPFFELNLEKELGLFKTVFNAGNIHEIVIKLSQYFSFDFKNNTAILFLDEIQAIPSALNMLRYFFEDYKNIYLISAGSILEFNLNNNLYSMPVGRVEFLFLQQLNFNEFLSATNKNNLLDAINAFNLQDMNSFNLRYHDELISAFKEYLLVGGMPEVVECFSQKKEFQVIQSNILNSYKDDLQKYPATAFIRDLLKEIFEKIPSQIGKKIKYHNLSEGSNSRDIKKALQLLIDAGFISAIKNTECSGIPLSATESASIYKIFYLDTGLYLRKLGLNAQDLFLLTNDNLINKGDLVEQFVCSEMLASQNYFEKPKLHYWLREGKANNAEVDFVIADGFDIIPIEVKSGAIGSIRSLQEFIKIKSPKIAIKLSLATPGITKIHNTHLLSLPVYFAGMLHKNIQQFKSQSIGDIVPLS